LVVAACAGGGPSGLGYGLPAQTEVTYTYTDTTIVSASFLGQNLEIAMRGAAEYGVVFNSAGDGVGVTLVVKELAASITMPFSAPVQLDESDVDGALVFSLDRRGNATVTSRPAVSEVASRMISGIGTAHTFFPGLPGAVVSTGDQWIDTVSYEGDAELGSMSELTILQYTIVGDTAVDGRSLLQIALTGTTELSGTMDVQGTPIALSSTVDVEGHVLWDARSGLMFEMVKTGAGRGSVEVAIAPQGLPIEVKLAQRARLQGG
jgi:hypothetical protein